MASFQSLEEVNAWELGLISSLDNQKKLFTEAIDKLLTDRNPFTSRAASNLVSLKLVKEDPKRVNDGIQNIKKDRPNLSEVYTVFETMIEPEVLDTNINKLNDAVFDPRGINAYLPFIVKITEEYIEEIKNIVQTTANIEKNNLDNNADFLQKSNKNRILFDTLILSQQKIISYTYGLTIPISIILAGMLIEELDNKNSDAKKELKQEGLESIMKTLKKYQEKEIKLINEFDNSIK